MKAKVYHFKAIKVILLIGALLFPLQAGMGQGSVGPEKGSLLIVGGGMVGPDIMESFIDLAGGPDAPIVVIPTAGGGASYDEFWWGLRMFRDAGITNITLLHTYDPEVANSPGFADPIDQARAVWFAGGRQWRLADAYLDTEVHRALERLLARGGLIAGSSAGATIQGSYLARGDTQTNTIMMGDHTVGMGFLKNSAIDQHLLERNRQFDLIEVIEAHPELLGIGIDEGTAVVVAGDQFRVIGKSYVAIYDHQHMLDSGGRFYFLRAGDRFDLRARVASRQAQRFEPLERVVQKNWNNR